MNRIIAALFPVLVAALTGCGAPAAKSAGGGTMVTDTSATVAAVLSDTLFTERMESLWADSDSLSTIFIRVDWPQGSDSLSRAVRSFVVSELASVCPPYGCLSDVPADQYPAYTGNADSARMLLDFYGQSALRYLNQVQEEMRDEYRPEGVRLSSEVALFKEAETERYVTCSVNAYYYLGGAHGSSYARCVNLSKRSFRMLGYTVDTARVADMQPLLRHGAVEYLTLCGEQVNDGNLLDYLFVADGMIPLPSQSPYLAPDGVHFLYQQYEIGPYALGMVGFTVPYADIRPYLTPEALELLDD